jgi:hypothetical protein
MAIIGFVVWGFSIDAKRKRELVDWGVSHGGHAVGSGVNIPSTVGEVQIRRITHDAVPEWNFAVHLSSVFDPVKIKARRFSETPSPAFRSARLDSELCGSLRRLKSQRVGIRRPNRKERSAGVVGSFVYLAWIGDLTPEERDEAVRLVVRLASLT